MKQNNIHKSLFIDKDLVGLLVFWAKSTTKDYIMAKNKVQPVSYLLCTQVTKPQIIQKPQNQSWHKFT